MGNVKAVLNHGTYYVKTAGSGGYAIPVAYGTYRVTFPGGQFKGKVRKIVRSLNESVLLDVKLR